MFMKLEQALKENENVTELWTVVSDRTEQNECCEEELDGSLQGHSEHRRTVVFCTASNHLHIYQSSEYKGIETLNVTVYSEDVAGDIAAFFNQQAVAGR